MRYREGGLKSSDEKTIKFTSSLDFDREIYHEVLEALASHTLCLGEKNLAPKEAVECILSALRKAYKLGYEKIASEGSFEDIHEAVENLIIKECGEKGYYMPLGRSRNDHVAAAIRMKLARRILSLTESIISLRKTLVEKASEFKNTLFPGHTHFQPAQALTYAHYLLSMEEELRDLTRILVYLVKSVILKSPLGSAALAGTSAPLDRFMLSEYFGMNREIVYNTLYATSSRFFTQITSSVLACVAVALTRYSEDYINMLNPALDFIEAPEHHLQTSSIMPHKRNPATLEVLRARAAMILGLDYAIKSIEEKLPIGYNLDLQEITKILWEELSLLEQSINILEDFIRNCRPKTNKILEYCEKYSGVLVEVAEKLAIEKKIPYRRAYFIIASKLREYSWNIPKVIESICNEYGIKLENNVMSTVNLKKTIGSPNPEIISDYLENIVIKSIRDDEKLLQSLKIKLYNTRARRLLVDN